jgi:hypothetical protein
LLAKMLFALGVASESSGDPTMEPTTGLILRRITQTDLSVSAHKLGCPRFAAILAVHGKAVLAGEIPR